MRPRATRLPHSPYQGSSNLSAEEQRQKQPCENLSAESRTDPDWLGEEFVLLPEKWVLRGAG